MSDPFQLLGRSVQTGAVIVVAAACGGSELSPVPPAPEPKSEAPSSSPAPATCDGSAARDLAVASDDLNGYPPYALADCSLVYVSSTGDLVLRDLATRIESTVAPAAERPRRPSASFDVVGGKSTLVIVWEATSANGSVVRVRYGERVSTVQGAFAMASEPRVRTHLVAFTAWNGTTPQDDTDVWLFDARTETARVVVAGPGQQRFADVSASYVVATDFSEDPDGRFDGVSDLADLVVFDIATNVMTRRAVPGKEAFPMISDGGSLGYLSWEGVHPEPKLEAYDLKAGPVLGDPMADRIVAHVEYGASEPARPALAGETLEWIENADGVTSLYRASANVAGPPVRVAGLDDLFLYAPAPSSGNQVFTVLAARSAADPAPRLRFVSR